MMEMQFDIDEEIARETFKVCNDILVAIDQMTSRQIDDLKFGGNTSLLKRMVVKANKNRVASTDLRVIDEVFKKIKIIVEFEDYDFGLTSEPFFLTLLEFGRSVDRLNYMFCRLTDNKTVKKAGRELNGN